jgi:hypothetical protein
VVDKCAEGVNNQFALLLVLACDLDSRRNLYQQLMRLDRPVMLPSKNGQTITALPPSELDQPCVIASSLHTKNYDNIKWCLDYTLKFNDWVTSQPNIETLEDFKSVFEIASIEALTEDNLDQTNISVSELDEIDTNNLNFDEEGFFQENNIEENEPDFNDDEPSFENAPIIPPTDQTVTRKEIYNKPELTQTAKFEIVGRLGKIRRAIAENDSDIVLDEDNQGVISGIKEEQGNFKLDIDYWAKGDDKLRNEIRQWQWLVESDPEQACKMLGLDKVRTAIGGSEEDAIRNRHEIQNLVLIESGRLIEPTDDEILRYISARQPDAHQVYLESGQNEHVLRLLKQNYIREHQRYVTRPRSLPEVSLEKIKRKIQGQVYERLKHSGEPITVELKSDIGRQVNSQSAAFFGLRSEEFVNGSQYDDWHHHHYLMRRANVIRNNVLIRLAGSGKGYLRDLDCILDIGNSNS